MAEPTSGSRRSSQRHRTSGGRRGVLVRIKLALATGAALVVLGTGGAAYAVVGGSVSPTTAGNVLPIDDNHSPITTTADDHGRSPEPGDDRGGATTGTVTTGTVTTGTSTTVTTDDHGAATEPGDDRGAATEPGDDRGAATEPGDDRGGATSGTVTTGTVATEPGDDRGRAAEPGDDRGAAT